jgi:hypothetical protein
VQAGAAAARAAVEVRRVVVVNFIVAVVWGWLVDWVKGCLLCLCWRSVVMCVDDGLERPAVHLLYTQSNLVLEAPQSPYQLHIHRRYDEAANTTSARIVLTRMQQSTQQ